MRMAYAEKRLWVAEYIAVSSNARHGAWLARAIARSPVRVRRICRASRKLEARGFVLSDDASNRAVEWTLSRQAWVSSPLGLDCPRERPQRRRPRPTAPA